MKLIVTDAFFDTFKMIPFLLLIYCLVEWIEQRYGRSIQARVAQAAKSGPAVGSVFGCVPQCGFSVLASAMYTRRFITIGTLLAVYLSTSDEAVPVILAQPSKARIVIPIVLTKLVIGIIGGYAVDLALKSYRKPLGKTDLAGLRAVHEKGCCEHHVSSGGESRESLLHPLIHTLKVFLFIFLVTVGINYLVACVGERNLGRVLLHNSVLQPVLAAIIGLIPNCAASVAITQLYLKGGISFGSAISGLCASGGLGILVLLKENHDARDTARVLGLLVGISVFVGIAIQYVCK